MCCGRTRCTRPRPISALAFDAAGNLALAWEQQRARLRPFRIEAARWPRAAQLPGSVQRLDQPDGRGAGHPVLVADPAGNLLCAWYQLGAQGLQVWMARFDASSLHWQAAQRLSQPRQTVRASLPALSVDTAGSVTAAWQQYNNWRNIIVARRLP